MYFGPASLTFSFILEEVNINYGTDTLYSYKALRFSTITPRHEGQIHQ